MVAISDPLEEGLRDTQWLGESLGALDASTFSSRSLEFEAGVMHERGSLIEVWRDDQARIMLKQLLFDGMFAHDPVIAESFCETISRASHENKTDKELYTELRVLVKDSILSGFIKEAFENDEIERVQRRALQLADELHPPARLVDVGSGDARIAGLLAVHWKKNQTEVIALDVEDRPNRSDQVEFRKIEDGAIPTDLKADAALLLMVLHHESQPEKLLGEVFEMLEPGGMALIRETDLGDSSDELFHAALDNLYYKVLNDLPGVPIPAMYRSLEEWGKLAVESGFRVEKVVSPEPDSPVKPFHMLLRKPDV